MLSWGNMASTSQVNEIQQIPVRQLMWINALSPYDDGPTQRGSSAVVLPIRKPSGPMSLDAHKTLFPEPHFFLNWIDIFCKLPIKNFCEGFIQGGDKDFLIASASRVWWLEDLGRNLFVWNLNDFWYFWSIYEPIWQRRSFFNVVYGP